MPIVQRTPIHVNAYGFGEKPLTCPFCGGYHLMLYAGPQPHITCMGCGADGPLAGRGDTAEAAISLWNKRRPQGAA